MARPPRSNLHPIVTAIARNIRAAQKHIGATQADVEKRSRGQVKQRTFSHAAAGKVAQQADTIARIAHALGLEPWQLLVPDLDPARPPRVGDAPHVLRATRSDDLLALLMDAWDRMDSDARFRLVEAARRGQKGGSGSGADPPALRQPSGLPGPPEGPRTAPAPPHTRR